MTQVLEVIVNVETVNLFGPGLVIGCVYKKKRVSKQKEKTSLGRSYKLLFDIEYRAPPDAYGSERAGNFGERVSERL